ncbi:hypothetical protein DB32_002686 [Sandaracinus amylolyticus]|uniref:Uncharacterized protein n=1 Tax=Sandaracinus amylolyticus TaxID=927083 RepID=A0A0F6W247_9BACT|nr:hypothetical protein DB32_002686 [Sandaracinus amylolyticus]
MIVSLALVACDSCERGGPVPFGLDGGSAGRARTEGPGETQARPDAPARASMVTRELPDGTAQVEVEGASIAIEGESLRALGAIDLDRDGDRDVVLVTGGTGAHGPRVLFASRDGAAFAAPIELATTPALASGCTIDRATLRALSDDRLAAEADATCASGDAPRVLHVIAIAAEARPRVLERFVLRARAVDVAPAESLALRIEDRDGDGHADLVADVALRAEGVEAAADVSLAFLDRPAGLARDATEPEARIAALAQEARTALRRHPDRARAIASRALTLWDALCREPGRARLEIGGAAGVPCGRSAGAGRALAVLAQAAARTSDPLLALDALSRLGSTSQISVRDGERDAARSALDGLANAALTIHEGPALEAPRERGPRRSVLAFLAEDRLLVRGSAPRVITLESGGEQRGADAESSLAMVDPSGGRRLVAIERRCAGTVLVIGPVDALADLGGARHDALIAPRRPPPGAPCPDLTPALRADEDGWRALGWAPQGVLLARGTELRVVPLDLEGRAAGDPVVLEAGAAIPAPIAPGHATADARVYAYATSAGLVVITLAPERRAEFVRPAGWVAPEGASIDVAVSPSGRRLAWIADGRVRWIERAP